MKSIDKTFSLFDFCKKKASKVQIYGEETLDDDGNIISFIDQAALITHYLQLKDSEISLPYVSKAESILGLWYEFIKVKRKFVQKIWSAQENLQYFYKPIFSQICFKHRFRHQRILNLHL